ncbi:hypothetical protein BGZ65_000604 [Modicella reniformis]|uniref:Mitochondrial carrier protein n=1 Tax=Modicella reniformis TaxID=1440133 RepID=A0A9P6MLT2_9FUNG|nr:hypothetical protein BGZ65_000604 [Modicella reniformis]
MPPVPEFVDHSKIDFRRYYFYATVFNVPPILCMYPFRTVHLLRQDKASGPVSDSVYKVARDVYRKHGIQTFSAGSGIHTTGVTVTGQRIKEQRYFGYPALEDSRVLSGVLRTFSAIVTTFFIVLFNMISQQITIAKAGTLPNASDIPLYVTGCTEPLEKSQSMTLSKSLHAQFRQEGFRFLFRGYFATLLSTAPFYAAYFPANEISTFWIRDGIDYIRDIQAARQPNPNPFPPTRSHQFLVSSIAGSMAAVAAVIASSPFDMVKSRIQTEQRLQPTNASGIKLPLPTLKWKDVFMDILKKEAQRRSFWSLKEVVEVVPPSMNPEERRVMLETLFALDKQFQGTARDNCKDKDDNNDDNNDWLQSL